MSLEAASTRTLYYIMPQATDAQIRGQVIKEWSSSEMRDDIADNNITEAQIPNFYEFMIRGRLDNAIKTTESI